MTEENFIRKKSDHHSDVARNQGAVPELSAVLLVLYASLNPSMARGVKKGVSKEKFERAVREIKRKGGARNPYAVANAKLGSEGRTKKKSRRR